MQPRPRLEWNETGEVPYLSDPAASEFGLALAFTSRLGGVSEPPFDSLNLSSAVGDDPAAVATNRARTSSLLGLPEGSIAVAKQVHGASVLAAATGSSDPIGDGDAVVAEGPGVAVGVLSADCVPIVLVGGGRVTAVHAGWRGLVAGVIEAACTELGTVEAAWVGPSIHACCYEVGPEVLDAFRARSLPVLEPDRVDPGRAAVVALRKCGVTTIASSLECTSCDERFFSHRRDGLTGRQGGFAAWL